MIRYLLAFGVALGGAQLITLPAYAQEDAVKCESRKFKYRECDADMRRPRIARQLSKSPCVAGDSWGFERGTIWVDRGCAAVFVDGRGDRPRWRDRDRYPDDRYPRRRGDDRVEFDLDL